jgi:hypothetical protein
MREQRDRLGAVAVLAVSLLLVLSVLGRSPALAIPGPNCENVNYNVEVTQGTQAGNHQGIKADVWFGAYNNDCNRITSIAVVTPGGNGYVEWGWVLGYSSCNGQYYTNPRTYTWWKPTNGASACAVWGSASQSTYYSLSLADANSDTVWLVKRDGSTVGTINVNFDRGNQVTNGERDCTCDSAWAHFKSLMWQVAGQSSWTNWTDPTFLYDNDPDYHWFFMSNTEHEIVHD